MEDYLINYELKIKILTPVYIGSGYTVGKREYIHDKSKNLVSFLDLDKLFKGILENGLYSEYEKYFTADNKSREFKVELKQFLEKVGIGEDKYSDWITYSEYMGSDNLSLQNTHEIQTFIKDGYGNPYIPGSSLKGAIRTILESCYIRNKYKEFNFNRNEVIEEKMGKKARYMSFPYNHLKEKVFHRQITDEKVRLEKMQNDIMRGIIVGDSHPIDKNLLCICQKIDLSTKGNKKSLNVLRECLKPGTEVTVPFTIDSAIMSNIYGKKFDLEDIKADINRFYKNYKNEYVCKFSGAPMVKDEKNAFYLGGGCGYVSKTVTHSLFNEDNATKVVSDILNKIFTKGNNQSANKDDETLGVSPHTLKCTYYLENLYQMGLCRIVD
jgi:CRISPR-associated RAMP protein, csm5 family